MLIRLIYALIVLLLTAVACTTTTPTALPEPTATAETLTGTPAPISTPTPTALELRNARATAVLTSLPGYDPAYHDALLPLARQLWGDDYLIDPADVTLAPGGTAVQVNTGADGIYPPGALLIWAGEAALALRPAGPGHLIQPGQATLHDQTFETWVEYDENGRLVRFLQPGAAHWVAPLEVGEDGRYNLYATQPVDSDDQTGAEAIWWVSGDQPVELITAPNGDPLAGYLAANTDLQLTESEINGRRFVALRDGNGSVLHILDAKMQWHRSYQAHDLVFERSTIYAADNPETPLVQLLHGTTIDWDTMPGYATISHGDNTLLMQEAEFHQLMQSRWDALSNQEAIDKYAVTSETKIVDFEGINVPITFAHNLTEYTISYDDLYYQDTAHRWLYASYMRYRIGYPDTSFENYLDLVREGKGQYVAPVLASADASTNEFIFVDPAKGMTFVLADTPDDLPIRIHTPGTDERIAQRMAYWVGEQGIGLVHKLNRHNFDQGLASMNIRWGWNDEQLLEHQISDMVDNFINLWISYPSLTYNNEYFNAHISVYMRSMLYRYYSHYNPTWSEQQIDNAVDEWMNSHQSLEAKQQWMLANYENDYRNGITVSGR